MKRLISALLIALLLLSSPGCWDLVELKRIGLVTIVGIDYDTQGDGFEVTVHIFQPLAGNGQSQGGGDGSSKAILVETIRGQTIMDALRNLRGIAGYHLTFHHARLLVIGEDLARKGVAPVLDFAMRTRELRINSLLLVCQGSAKDFLRIQLEVSDSLQTKLEGLLDDASLWSKSQSVQIFRFIQELLDPGKQPVATRLLKLSPEPGNPTPIIDNEEKPAEEVAIIEGLAVFNDDKLVDWLTGTETIGYRYLTGEGGEMILVVPWRGAKASLEVHLNSCSKDVSFSQGIPTFEITLYVSIDLVEYTGYLDVTPDVAEELRNLASQQITGILESTVEKAKALGVDFLGFGGIVSRRNPRQWAKLNTQWREVFPEIKAKYDIRADMLMPGLWSESIPR
jgi:spore germination protein KC